jgi:hypothetical protein
VQRFNGLFVDFEKVPVHAFLLLSSVIASEHRERSNPYGDNLTPHGLPRRPKGLLAMTTREGSKNGVKCKGFNS